MTYKYSTFFKVINVVTDYVLLNMAYSFCLYAHQPENFIDSIQPHHQLNFLLMNLCWFFCSNLLELYVNVIKRAADDTIRASVTALVMFSAVSIAVVFTFPQLELSFTLMIEFLILSIFLHMLWKVSFLLVRKSRRRFWIEFKNILLVGAGPVGMDLYSQIIANPYLGYRVEGVFDDSYPATRSAGPAILGKVDRCFEYAKAHNISEVYCALPISESVRIKNLMKEADRQMIRMRVIPDLSAILDANVMLELYGRHPILTARYEPLENKVNEIIKRIFDVLFSLGAIVFILSWLAPVLAVLIKLESKGPVFFRQLRSGKNNKPFYCLKFRSMTVNIESDIKQASRGDRRITRIGAFLRRTSIDELPQFINVLFGDMSVVGPRPHMLKHTEDYSLLIQNYMVRHFLTPGITGWAQVNGFRGATKEPAAMSKRVDADIWYLEHWSLFLDLKIVFLTIWQGLRKNENAY